MLFRYIAYSLYTFYIYHALGFDMVLLKLL